MCYARSGWATEIHLGALPFPSERNEICRRDLRHSKGQPVIIVARLANTYIYTIIIRICMRKVRFKAENLVTSSFDLASTQSPTLEAERK